MSKESGVQLRPWLVPRIRPADLAREAGCSRQYVSAVLGGHKPASQKLLDAAKRLGVPVDVIYRDAA